MTLDRYGDPLPTNALLRLGTVRLRHSQGVAAVAFASNGQLLASISSDETVSIWEVSTGRRLYRIKLSGRPCCLAFSPDALTVAVGGVRFVGEEKRRYGFVALVNANGGDLRRELCFNQESSTIEAIAISPDGRVLATAGFDTIVRLLDAVELREIGHCGFGDDHWCTDLDFSPDGKMIAVSQGPLNKGRIVLLESVFLHELTPAIELPTTNDPNVPRCVHFSRDGTMLASGGDDKRLSVWNIATRNRIICLSGHRPEHWGAVDSVRYSSDGKLLISGGLNEAIVREAENGSEIFRFAHGGSVHGLTNSKDSSLLAVSSANLECPTISVFSLSERKRLLNLDAHESSVCGLVFLPRSNSLLSSGNDNTVRIWNLESAKTVRVLSGFANISFLPVISPDRQLMAAYTADRVLQIWSLTNETEPKVLSSVPAFGKMCFTPDSRYIIALPSGGKGPVIWEASTGKEIGRFEGEYARAQHLAVSPDGRRLIVASSEEVRLLCMETRQLIVSWSPGLWIYQVDFPPTGQDLLILAEDENENRVLRFSAPESGQSLRPDITGVRRYAFAPDGKLLITGNGTSIIGAWDFPACTDVKELDTGDGFVSALGFAADGMRFATGATDTTIHVWSTKLLRQ